MAAAFVKHLDDNTASLTASTLTLTVPSGGVTAGHSVIVVAVAALTDSCAVTDSAGNTYTQDQTGAASTTVGVRVFSVHNCLGLTAGQTITVTWTSSHAFLLATADEFSGLAGSVDDSSSATASATPFTSGTTNTTGSADLVYAAFGNQTSVNTLTYTAGSGFTRITTAHALSGSNGRDLNTEYKLAVAAGAHTATLTSATNHLYAGVQVAYQATTVAATASLTLTAAAASTLTVTTTGTATLTLLAATNAFPASGAATLDLSAQASAAPNYRTAGAAGLTLTALALSTVRHIPVETDLTFRISTDDLIVDAAVVTVDGVTSITGPGGDKKQVGTDTTITADLTDNSQLAGFNAGKSKARHLYRLKSKPRKNAPTITLNAAPTAPKINGDGTVGAGAWTLSASPTSYQAAVAVDISDLISVAIVPPGGGDALVARYWVEGIRHGITADGSWSVTLNISRADENPSGGYWQLGQSRLGSTTVLTW